MPTLKDVARRADVSVSTVSRVFNNPEKVRPDTRQRVREIADTLGYRPNRVARRLRLENGTAGLIGLVIPDIQNPFFADVVRGVEDVIHEHDYALVLSNSDEDAERQKMALDTFRTEDVDGVIVPPVRLDDPAVRKLSETSTPLVCVDRGMKDLRVDTISSANRQGAYDAITHLIELGHERIAFIGGIGEVSTAIERREGYKAALRDHDLPVDDSLIKEGEPRRERGRAHTEALLERRQSPTALFTGNNLATLGTLSTLNRHGIHVPQEMALVGYDDIPWAMALNPPPTVVDQPGYEMGNRAADLLFRRIDEPERSATVVTLQPKLVIRRSCGANRGKE